MAEQTSVEWFLREIGKYMDTWNIPDEVIEEAKEKHKEETMDAFQAGKWDGYENKVCGSKQFKDPAEYYNEIFNK